MDKEVYNHSFVVFLKTLGVGLDLVLSNQISESLKRGEFGRAFLIPIIFNNAFFVKEDDQGIFLLLNPGVLEEGQVGEVGFLDGELGGVLAEIGIDEDIAIILLLNPIRRAKGLKDFTFGGGAGFDLLFRIMPDLRADIDPSDAATP